jgi:hypothetical protein
VFSVGYAPRLYNGKFQSISALLEVKGIQLKKSSFEWVVVENWVEFWRWK